METRFSGGGEGGQGGMLGCGEMGSEKRRRLEVSSAVG
jgi:hypothetical protein